MDPAISLTITGGWIQWVLLVASTALLVGAVLQLATTILKFKIAKLEGKI